MNPVAVTALLVAAMRAEESKRRDRLFDDPFAHALAGDAGYAALRAYRDAVGPSMPIIEVRTRWFDEALARAAAAGVAQVVLLAAGMDARAYRLEFPAGTRVFEIDQPEVIAHKAGVLGTRQSASERVTIAADLAGDWPAALLAARFDPAARTVWSVEGLLQYLDGRAVETLMARIDRLSAPRSILLYDVVGKSLLESPALAAALRMMAELGAPWIFGTDDPAGLVAVHGWDAAVVEPGEVGTRWGRWPIPPAPAGAPRGHLVEATKR
ncbi:MULTISPECIES: SAM-dependent methyltransferase [Sorangium]|uniref:S-adenosyl-L-methionine-dependent methyltransferase n=1 Tax=Sorangium cellulosum TaxID=56 RepID=A0A4P2QRV0_SORCE|nr:MULTISPECIES: SAM-dependent methyltransferase [Sorangium]AUX33027.1 methyltransferase [Sorangium cellulosum]WCQ92403.1 Putative S-adenosyl-L-methionine-dependent methyltransferase [Sorangium sp. Soce836]